MSLFDDVKIREEGDEIILTVPKAHCAVCGREAPRMPTAFAEEG